MRVVVVLRVVVWAFVPHRCPVRVAGGTPLPGQAHSLTKKPSNAMNIFWIPEGVHEVVQNGKTQPLSIISLRDHQKPCNSSSAIWESSLAP